MYIVAKQVILYVVMFLRCLQLSSLQVQFNICNYSTSRLHLATSIRIIIQFLSLEVNCHSMSKLHLFQSVSSRS